MLPEEEKFSLSPIKSMIPNGAAVSRRTKQV